KQMHEDYFPVDLNAMGAEFIFLNLNDDETLFGAHAICRPQYNKYIGGSYAIRLEDEGAVLVFCTDIEHIDGIDQNIVELARNADLLIHDGQYTTEEYKQYKGWGHSTWRQAIEVALQANVKKLIITHHDPDHDDEFLDKIEKECQEIFPNCVLAKEGMEVKV
ncbi:MAG: MBL fold metallo-hydrolase, partial [Bacteroidota bacterium]